MQNIQLLLNEEGYLKSPKLWNLSIAQIIAKTELIQMTTDHWIIVKFVRKFYLQFHRTPSMKMISVALNKKLNKKNISIYLFRLFPKGPAQQASKIAGIPKPNICL